MSIIYDALNKAQKEHSLNDNKPKRRKPLSAFIILVIILPLSILVFIDNPLKKSPNKLIDYTEPIKHPQTVTKINDVSEFNNHHDKPEDKDAGLSLSGVSISETETLAIINDNIVKVGDFVNGFKVLSIYENFVELERKNEKIILNMNK